MKQIIFADLDGTLIETASGKTFPVGIWDMEFKFNVLDQIGRIFQEFKSLDDTEYFYLFIVTNQGGIELGHVQEDAFVKKMEYISMCISEYLGREDTLVVDYVYCASNLKTSECRKPNVGMLQAFMDEYQLEGMIEKDKMLMIGDASGLPGQHSDSDMKCAEKFGIDYMDVSDFIRL